MNRSFPCVWGLLAVTLCWGHSVRADIPISIAVTIVEPVCSVTGTDGGGMVTVDFGGVQLQDINTAQAEEPLHMRVSCPGAAPGAKVLQMLVSPVSGDMMTVGGTPALGTSMPGLGIRLSDADGNVVEPGMWTPVNGVDTTVEPENADVVLQARLVSEKADGLTADTFRASASVVMTYL